MENIQFARGLGFGLGHSFKYLEVDFKQTVIEIAGKNIQFAIGLGEGLGPTITNTESNIHYQKIENPESSDSFMIGLGISHAKSSLRKYSIHKYDKNKGFFSTYLHNNIHFQKGFGLGIGSIFTYLSTDLKEELIILVEKNYRCFNKTFGFALGHSFPYMSNDDKIIINNIQNEEFTYFFGRGLGHNFLSLNQDVQQELIRHMDVSKDTLSIGIVEDIYLNFPYMDKNLQQKISEITDQ